MSNLKLGQLINVSTGKLNANCAVKNGEYPFFTCSKEISRINQYSFDCECVLLSGNGDIDAKYYNGKFDAYQRTYVLVPKDKTKLNIKFLFYFFKYYVSHLNNQSIGGVIKYIKLSNITNAEIKDYDLQSQNKICNELENIFLSIDKLENNLNLLDTLIKSRFNEMFGDVRTNSCGFPLKRIDEISNNLDSKRIPITSSKREKGNIPYYGASGIVDYVKDFIFDDDLLLVSEDGANLLARSTPIAFPITGKTWVNNHAHVLKFSNLSIQKYVECYFSTIDISEYVTGSAQPKLNQAKLNSIQLPYPPITAMNEFAKFVKLIDKSKFIQ